MNDMQFELPGFLQRDCHYFLHVASRSGATVSIIIILETEMSQPTTDFKALINSYNTIKSMA